VLVGRFIFLLLITSSILSAAPREYSFDLWDWTTPCRDLATFKKWAADLKSIGVTRLEISAPWNLMEPAPGRFDTTFVTDRLAVAKSSGLGLRVRINSYFGGATPAWYDGDRWRDVDGKEPLGTPVPVSMCDDRFWPHYGALSTTLATACRGEDVYFNSFIGVHAELKWADWWSYDASTLKLWRKTIRKRPEWLVDLVGDAELPDMPPIPPATHGSPDVSAKSIAWIAFREQVWREAERKFNDAIRRGNPNARTSAPLGESYRAGSAQMSNLDYFGLSRGASQIVHSYDFFWHTKAEAWNAAAAVASFQGITGIANIEFEFDGAAGLEKLGYTNEHQIAIARAVLAQGAGIKVANNSYDVNRLPSSWPILVELGKLAHGAGDVPPPPPRDRIVLLFVSKWCNYCFRESTEWVHEKQFAAWRELTSKGVPVRMICEDNLGENLTGYRALGVAFCPIEVLPKKTRMALDALSHTLPKYQLESQ
jgi:hypothetical protein